MRPKKPKSVRPTTEEERNGLSLITWRALSEAGGGANFQIATRVDASKLSEYASVSHKDRFMGIDIVADLERMVGYPWISEHLVQMQGYSIVPSETLGQHPDMGDAIELSDMQGKLFSLLIKALANDGRVDARESRDMLPTAEALKAKLEALIKVLKGISE